MSFEKLVQERSELLQVDLEVYQVFRLVLVLVLVDVLIILEIHVGDIITHLIEKRQEGGDEWEMMILPGSLVIGLYLTLSTYCRYP